MGRIPSGGEDGGNFSVHAQPGRQCVRVGLSSSDSDTSKYVVILAKMRGSGNGDGEAAISRNQTSLSTVRAVREENTITSKEYRETVQ